MQCFKFTLLQNSVTVSGRHGIDATYMTGKSEEDIDDL